MTEQTHQPQMTLHEMALSQMEARYGITFEYHAPFGDSLSGTHMFLATTDSFPGQVITVEIENFRYSDRLFLNNFLAVKHRNETIEFLHNRVTKVFNEANIFYEVARRGLSQDLPPDATLEEFLADTRIHLIVMVEVKESEFISDDDAIRVAELIAESGANFVLRFIVVDDDLFGSFTRESLGGLIPLRHFVRGASIAHFDGYIETIWMEGS